MARSGSPKFTPRADGFGDVTPARECGPITGSLPRIEIAMIRNATISSIGMTVLAATAFIAAPVSAQSSFGQLTYGVSPSTQTPIAMTSGTGVGNDGYYKNTTTGPGAQQLLIGIKAHEYRNGNMPAGSSTVSSLYGGGSWLNIDSGTSAYTAIAGVAVNTPSWNPAAPSWGFTWSITLDGARPAVGAISMRMLITRPDSQVVTVVASQDVGTDFSAGNMAWQQNWNLGYLGVYGNGVDANTLGDWKIKISTFSGSTVYGEQEITVTATPAPGALALLGVAGLVGGRRRRAC
jgi:MYXO-CTERM domain-containing protein